MKPARLALLFATLAVGAYLRFDGLGEPSYWLDEILHQQLTTTIAAKPWWQWIGRVEEENGGLYYLTQLATRAFGTSEFAGRLAAATFGVSAIALLFAVRIKRAEWTSVLAAVLLAASPLHVYYSRDARPYALLMLLTMASIVVLLRARSLLAFVAILLAMVYTSVVASTVVLSAAILCALLFWQTRERWYAKAGACALGAMLLFRAIYTPRLNLEAGLGSAPGLDWPFFTKLARMFSVTALGDPVAGRAAVAMLVFAIIGLVWMVMKERREAIVIGGMTLLPLAMMLAAVQFFDHFFSIRFVTVSLIGYVLLAASGIVWTSQLVARKAGPVLAIAIACVFAQQAWPAARTEPWQKLDWRSIAREMRSRLRPGDVILAAEPWSEVSLRYYLGEVPNVQLVHMAGVDIAEVMARGHRASWLITAGSSRDASVRGWMCGYPIVMASALEDLRLHYAPSARDLLQHRATAAELRAVSAALGDRGFRMRMDNDLLLGEGWADAEGAGEESFRWAVGKRATIAIPRPAPRDRTIRFDTLPIAAQNVRISLNGHDLGTIALAYEWRTYTIDAPAASWIDGLNVLAFDFERAFAPSATDHRELASVFRWIAIDDRGFISMRPARIPSFRIAADTFLDAPSAWRNTPTRFDAASFQRQPTEALLGRLGIDPRAGWTQLTRGAIHLEDLASTIANGSDCQDDRTFLYRAFAILLERDPNGIEERDLLRRMRAGATRTHIIKRILNADDFAPRYSPSPAAPRHPLAASGARVNEG